MLSGEKINVIDGILGEVQAEVKRAIGQHSSPMHSPHEAHSVIEEEFDEFWDEVKLFNPRKGRDTRPRMREELIQLAAMAVRAITEVIDMPEGDYYASYPEFNRVPSGDAQKAGNGQG